MSTEKQEIYIEQARKKITFDEWESIHTEYSFKYSESQIRQIIKKAHFKEEKFYFDSKKYFCDVLMTKR